MAKPPPEDLETFLERQDPATLVAVLLELANDHEAVQARLARMQIADRPDELAAGFRKTLSAWKRSGRFYGYREAGEFGRMLHDWLDQVERELLPKDPAAARGLFETFIEADAHWFEHADDSGGVIGDAVRAACRLWLQAAAPCESPAAAWSEHLLELYVDDRYGARGELLRSAHLVLDETAQRGLVSRIEGQLSLAVDASPDGANPSFDVFRLSGALSLLAESLRDPDVKVRATLRYSPDPNPVQRQAFARAYLDADRPVDALVWLQESWGHLDGSREGLLADALERLGRFDESVPIRKAMFERTPARRDGRLPRAAEGDPRSRLRTRLRSRGPLLGTTTRDRRRHREPGAATVARGLRGRNPRPPRAQEGVLGLRERNAPRPARRLGGRRGELTGRHARKWHILLPYPIRAARLHIAMSITSVFTNNRSQAVRLPADARLPEGVKKVRVRARGVDRIISPVGHTWDEFFLNGPVASDDFMAERAAQHQADREAL